MGCQMLSNASHHRAEGLKNFSSESSMTWAANPRNLKPQLKSMVDVDEQVCVKAPTYKAGPLTAIQESWNLTDEECCFSWKPQEMKQTLPFFSLHFLKPKGTALLLNSFEVCFPKPYCWAVKWNSIVSYLWCQLIIVCHNCISSELSHKSVLVMPTTILIHRVRDWVIEDWILQSSMLFPFPHSCVIYFLVKTSVQCLHNLKKDLVCRKTHTLPAI